VTPQPSILNSQPPPAGRQWPRRLRSVVLWSCGLVVLLAAFCFVFRSPLLRAAANAWIINDPVTHADAIIVLGGGLEYRPFAAARIYSNLVHQSTLNPQRSTPNSLKVLITQPELPPTTQMGLTLPEFVLARQVLLTNGVPASAIQMLGTNVTSTRDEALAVRAWLATNSATCIIIPTDILHTRRVRWIFQKALSDIRLPASDLRPPASDRIQVRVAAVELPRYSATNWWQREEGLVSFQNEVVKSLYYHLRY
jgi:uncharacterized SAM-binding protein YcdF (DUF218 family)